MLLYEVSLLFCKSKMAYNKIILIKKINMLNFEKIIITKFDNYKSIKGKDISLKEWFEDKSFKEKVFQIRDSEDKEQIRLLKSYLPVVTMSGNFITRNSNQLITHSGLICIDIDSKDNPLIEDFEKFRDSLKQIENIAYASLSVSGKGVFCLIPLKYTEKHKEHFEALKFAFNQLNISIDNSCGDVSRLRGYSYDENAYVNENALPFEEVLEKKKISNNPQTSIVKNYKSKHKRDFLDILEKIKESGVDLTKSYQQWFEIGCAIANEFGEEGRNYFQTVSSNYHQYSDIKVDALYSQCIEKRYDYTIGTFFYYAKQFNF